MAPAPKLSLFGRVRLHILDPDTTTSRGYLSGIDAAGTHSKRFDQSALRFTGNVLEGLLAADQTALEHAFAVAEVEYDGGWLAIGTPYMLAPGSGTVVGSKQGAAREQIPVAVGALQGMLDGILVFATEADPDHPSFKKVGGLERNRYLNCFSKGYDEDLHPGQWHDANVYDPTGLPKEGKPEGWPEVLAGAKLIFRDADEGGRTCARFGTFELLEDKTVVFWYVSDEDGKLFADGPNQGGILINWDSDEDGFVQGGPGHCKRRLKAGVYSVGAHMLTINSEGGDGNDSMRFGCYSLKTDGSGDIDEVLLVSDESTRVLRQPVGDRIPGMSPGENLRRLLQVAADLGSEYAQLLLDNRTFTDAKDTDELDWTTFVEWMFPLDASLASALADELVEIDLDMGTEFSFDAWQDRGTNHGSTGDVVVEIAPGAVPPTADMNVTDYGWKSDPAGPNAFLTESQEGSALYFGDVPDGQRRRFGSITSGSSGTMGQAKRNAHHAVKANGEARRYYDGEIVAVPDAVPWVHFTICDLVHGRGYRNLGLNLEATALSWAQGKALKVTVTMAEPVS